MTVLSRTRVPELMDEPGVEPAELHRSLADLRAVNRWLGGERAMVRSVARLAAAAGRRGGPLRILDVGTGSGDLPLRLVTWGRRAGVSLKIVASDLHPRTLAYARRFTAHEPAITVEEADALDLPYRSDSFDLAICSTTLHHFDEPEARALIGGMWRVSALGITVHDFRRSVPALLGVHVLAATVWRRHPVTRHDAPASVRASYTPAEVRQLASEAGVVGAVVRRYPVFRVELTALKGAGDP